MFYCLLSGLEYFYYIGIPVIILCLIIILFIIITRSKSKNKAKNNETHQRIIEAFGGKTNIQSIVSKGSRLTISLKDYSLLDEIKLKNHGVTSIIKMSNKITVVIGEQAKEIENYFNKN